MKYKDWGMMKTQCVYPKHCETYWDAGKPMTNESRGYHLDATDDSFEGK